MTALSLSVRVYFITTVFVALGPINTVKSLTLLPNDPVACTSQNITLVCNDMDQNATVLYFALPGTNDNIVTNINGTKVNETAYELTLNNISANDSNQNILCCRGDCNTAYEISVQFLSVYEMPEPVKNFQCVVYNWLENMNCSWELAFPYGASAVVTLYWMILDGAVWMHCPGNSIGPTTYCFWNSTEDGDFSKKKINFKIDIASKCGINATSEYRVDTNTIVKPAPVTDLNSNATNSSCATLTWKTTRNEHGKIHFVYYTSKWGNGKKTLYDTEETRQQPKNMTVCDLHPYTIYIFTVQVMPLDNGYMSDPVTTTVQTYPDIPSAGPELRDGGYMWNPKDCSHDNEERLIYIYWKLLPDESKNGVLMAFHVEFEPSVSVNDVPADTSHAAYTIKCGIDYNVNVYARNDIGLSTNRSSFYIPKAQTGSQPQFIVEMSNKMSNDSIIYVTLVHYDFKAKGNTVFWCRRDQGNCAINNEVDWRVYEGNVNQINLTWSGMANPEDYLYGVSMDTKHGSSGLSWQSCIYTRNVPPNKPPGNVIMTSGVDDNSLDVRWDKFTCESGQPFISTYRIEICRGESTFQCEAKREWEKDFNDNQLIVENLDAEQFYSVKVRGVTSDKLEGPWSQPISGKPVDKSLKIGQIVGIVLGGLFVLIFVLSGSVCIFRHCKKIGKKKLEIAITVPGNHEQTEYLRQDSQDSGIPEDQPNSPKQSRLNIPLNSDYCQMTTDGSPTGRSPVDCGVDYDVTFEYHNASAQGLTDTSAEPNDTGSSSDALVHVTPITTADRRTSDTGSIGEYCNANTIVRTDTIPEKRSVDTSMGIGEYDTVDVLVPFVTTNEQLCKQSLDGMIPKLKMTTESADVKATIASKVNLADSDVLNKGDPSVAHKVKMDQIKCHNSLNNSSGNQNNNHFCCVVDNSGNHCIQDYVQACCDMPRGPAEHGHAATSDGNSEINASSKTIKSQVDNESAENVSNQWPQNSSGNSSWQEVNTNDNNLDLHVMSNDTQPDIQEYITIDKTCVIPHSDIAKVGNNYLDDVSHGATVSSQSQNSDSKIISNGDDRSANNNFKSQEELESSLLEPDKSDTSLKLNVIPSIINKCSNTSHSQVDQKSTRCVSSENPFSDRSQASFVSSPVTASSVSSPLRCPASSVSSLVPGIDSSMSSPVRGAISSVSSPVTVIAPSLSIPGAGTSSLVSMPVRGSDYVTLQSVSSLAPFPSAVNINTDHVTAIPTNNDTSNTITNCIVP